MTIFFYRKPLVAGSAYKIESGGANYQHEFAKHWASCCLCWKIIIQFQKCLLKANHDSPSDSHFKYILDLTDKSSSNLARNVSVLRCLLTLICWTLVQIFFYDIVSVFNWESVGLLIWSLPQHSYNVSQKFQQVSILMKLLYNFEQGKLFGFWLVFFL